MKKFELIDALTVFEVTLNQYKQKISVSRSRGMVINHYAHFTVAIPSETLARIGDT